MVQVLVLAVSLVAPVGAATAAEDKGYIGIMFKFDDDKKTATVLETTADGPAAKAGVKAGDVITKIDGKAIDSSDAFVQKVGDVKPGDTLTLTVTRDGKDKEVKVKAGKRPDPARG